MLEGFSVGPWIFDHLDKFGFFSDLQYGFRSSQSTADLLTVASNRIARAFSRFGAAQPVALYPRLLTEFGMLVFFTNLGLMEFQVISGLIYSFLSN